MAGQPRHVSRRGFLIGVCALPLAGPAFGQAEAPVYVISRSRLLNESEPTRILREAEQALTAKLQSELDRVKGQLAREEADLARRRDEIPAAEMARLATDFDRRVRLYRSQAKEKAATVQAAFQEARAKLVLTLPPILERLRIEAGAVAILDADQALAIAPNHDLTDRAIALLNENVPSPEVPEVDVSLEIPPPEPAPDKSE